MLKYIFLVLTMANASNAASKNFPSDVDLENSKKSFAELQLELKVLKNEEEILQQMNQHLKTENEYLNYLIKVQGYLKKAPGFCKYFFCNKES